MPLRRSALSRPRRQRGVTLVELMVGLTLGLFVSGSLLLVFANASAQGKDLARAGMQIENGRYISELLREDLRLAGFFGETSVIDAAYSDPDPCSTTPTGWGGSPLTLPAPVRGVGAGEALGCLPDRKADTEALVIRRVGVERVDPSSLAGGNTQHYVQYSFCINDVSSPRLVFGADRNLFVSSSTGLRNRACNAPNTIRAYVSRIYYIAACNRCGVNADGIPTLKRVDLVGNTLTTTALAEGVETLRLEYGFDGDDRDGAPNRYLTGLGPAAEASGQWSNVVAMKTHFIVRSLEKVTGANLARTQTFELGGLEPFETPADGYTRRAYSNVVRLVNPSAVREVQ